MLVACLCAPSLAAAAGPGAYMAQRFDVDARVLPGGHLDVTETITFVFQSGTFRKVWREIPASRTDGIEIAEAWMDDERFTQGEGPGHITVTGRNRIRVEWLFAPTQPSTHTIRLRYIARGVAYRQGEMDVVRWRLLPNEHRYRIDASRLAIAASVDPAGTPQLEKRRVDHLSTATARNGIEITATNIATNGWVIAEVHYPAGSLVTTLPTWQQRHHGAAAAAPRWTMAAGTLFVVGLMIVVMARQSYPTAGFDISDHATTTEPPEPMPAALVAALVGKGRTSGLHSVATLLDLADRGMLTVRELPRKFGVHNYELSQVPGNHHLEEHEKEALAIAFDGRGDDVTMAKARARLARKASRFSDAVDADLAKRGLIDRSRKAVRDRLTGVSVLMLLAAGVAAIGAGTLIPRYEAWPFLLPLAMAISGIIGMVMTAATTPLSDAGLILGARWRGFKRHLKSIAEEREARGDGPVQPRWIVYGIALGLSYQWSRYLKKHPHAAPPWFVAGTSQDPSGAFAVFIGSNSASTSASGGHGGGGAAAGGGGSGAG